MCPRPSTANLAWHLGIKYLDVKSLPIGSLQRRKRMTVISVIVGSNRQGRFSEKPARWILEHVRQRAVEARLLDLRDYPMPFFDEAATPAMPNRAPYANEVVRRWTAEIAAADGFVFVTPEYNYGPPAV